MIRWLAALVLFAFSTSYAAPLQLLLAGGSHACCSGKASGCCRKHGQTSKNCANQCLCGLQSPQAAVPPSETSVATLPAGWTEPRTSDGVHRTSTDSPSRYQRPPPHVG